MCQQKQIHQENIAFVLAHGLNITDYDPDDNPTDEMLIPEEARV